LTNVLYIVSCYAGFTLTFKGRIVLSSQEINETNGEFTDRLKYEVISEQSPEMAIIALQDITGKIVSYPRDLLGEDLDMFRDQINKALKRVLSINKGCFDRVASKHDFRGSPEDWVNAVLSLRILKKTNVA